MKKQTAIKWLINELENNGIKHIDLCEEIINKAKEKEKEQMENAFEDGVYGERPFEQYYNETFGDDAQVQRESK